jgi:hypothetical protein
MEEIKRVPRKLRGKGVLMVDKQVLLRRKRLKKLGIEFDSATSRHAKKKAAREQRERDDAKMLSEKTKKWF